MKKTLALVLALAMVFSTITVAFAEETIGADAQICADLGMLKGETGTVDAAYTATAPTRIQAAVMVLRLRGLEEEAKAFTGEANFVDADKAAWAKPIMAYLKANPQLGWAGDGANFNPTAVITAKEYYKVMLEALGYKQTVTGTVEGDFTWDNAMDFAASKGLAKVAAVTNYTVNDLAIATVETLKANMKDGGKTLVASLVEAGKVDKAKAIAAGLMTEAPAAVAVAVDSAMATGNAVVDVTFEDDVDASAANAALYTIEGLTIKAATAIASDVVRLDTDAMTSGKIYKLTVGEKTVQFTGVAKVSGGPEIDSVVSEDVEEVVINFSKNIDAATGTDVANYSIAGVTIVSAEVCDDEVTLTTEGLKNKTKYTVKVTNVKSVDGVNKKSTSESFTSKYDLVAPKIAGDVEVQTNQRVVITFNEKITTASAENLENYSIKVDETNGAELEITAVKFITSGTYKNKRVELTTETMEKREDYKLSISNIADRRKVANVMTRPATKDFKGVAEDKTAPTIDSVTVLSPTTFIVAYKDNGSRIDEASALDVNNYDIEDLDIESITTLKDEWQEFKALVTVEEMETNKTYSMKITDIADEFGNAMKETPKTVKGVATSFASSKLTSFEVSDKDTVTLVFDKDLDETTAENLANYSIDEEVGAPTEATLEDDDKTVTLIFDDLIDGFDDYDLTVDGVQDLAGNVLYFKKTLINTEKWDTEAPEVQDADVVNELNAEVPGITHNYTVALSFDEKVAFEANAYLELYSNITYKLDGSINTKNTTYLAAKDLVDDDTVVEFSGALADNEEYTVARVVYGDPLVSVNDGGVKDLIGNQVLAEKITVGDFEFAASAGEPDKAVVDTYEQTNATTFEVTMTRNVQLTGAATQKGFAVSVDTDDNTLVTFEKVSGIIEEDKDYEFDFASFLKDLHGLAVDDADDTNLTVLTGEYTDKDAPEIEEVVAKNRETIKVVFSEDIAVDGADTAVFTLKNYDLDTTITVTLDSDSLISDDDGDNVLYLTVSKPLEARYEYELTLAKGTDTKYVLDFAGIKHKDEQSFYFDGTNLAK